MKKILVCKNCERDVSKPIELSEDIAEDLTEGIGHSWHATDFIVPVGQAVSLRLEQSDDGVVFWMNGNDFLERISFDQKSFGCCGL